jgi:hypothetical protein
MAILHDKKVTEKYGIYEERATLFSKFRTRVDDRGELKYRARENKSNKVSRDFYNVKGQAIFRIKVSSYKVKKNTLIRDFVSEEEVIVESSFISQHKKEIIENAKLQALYSHYRKKGDVSLINDTKRLMSEIVKFELIDYIVDYNKGYNTQLRKPRLIMYKDNKFLNTQLYNEKTQQYEDYTSSERVSLDKNMKELQDQALKQEENYSKIDTVYI